MARKKSINDIVRQAADIAANARAQRRLNRIYGGRYNDAVDRKWRNRENQAIRAMNAYTGRIHDKQGTNNGLFNGDRRPIASDVQKNKKYPYKVYMGLANG